MVMIKYQLRRGRQAQPDIFSHLAIQLSGAPAGTAQRITNTGESDLIFLCVCMPRFTPDSYESLEEESFEPLAKT